MCILTTLQSWLGCAARLCFSHRFKNSMLTITALVLRLEGLVYSVDFAVENQMLGNLGKSNKVTQEKV